MNWNQIGKSMFIETNQIQALRKAINSKLIIWQHQIKSNQTNQSIPQTKSGPNQIKSNQSITQSMHQSINHSITGSIKFAFSTFPHTPTPNLPVELCLVSSVLSPLPTPPPLAWCHWPWQPCLITKVSSHNQLDASDWHPQTASTCTRAASRCPAGTPPGRRATPGGVLDSWSCSILEGVLKQFEGCLVVGPGRFYHDSSFNNWPRTRKRVRNTVPDCILSSRASPGDDSHPQNPTATTKAAVITVFRVARQLEW